MKNEDYYNIFDSEQVVPIEEKTIEQECFELLKEFTITTAEQLCIRLGISWDYQFEPAVLKQLKTNKEIYNKIRESR